MTEQYLVISISAEESQQNRPCRFLCSLKGIKESCIASSNGLTFCFHNQESRPKIHSHWIFGAKGLQVTSYETLYDSLAGQWRNLMPEESNAPYKICLLGAVGSLWISNK